MPGRLPQGVPNTITIASLLWVLFAAYIVAVAAFLITENRRPEAAPAWLLAFITLPVLGVMLYFFFGRGWKAFSQEKKLALE